MGIGCILEHNRFALEKITAGTFDDFDLQARDIHNLKYCNKHH